MEIAGATALVTGASGGLGREIAQALDARGARLLLSGRRRPALDALAGGLRDAEVVVCDLTDQDQIGQLAMAAKEADIVVANAGLPAAGRLDDFTPAEIDRALEVNLRAPILLVHALLPGLLERRRGHIVLVSSISGKLATPRLSLYSATKFGLRGFAGGLRHDLVGSGVGVSLVLPGAIDDAGLWVEGELTPPKSAMPKHVRDVGRAVVRAIERDRAEVHVAPVPVRLGILLAEVAPDAMAKLVRRGGAESLGDQMVEAFRPKR